MTYVSRRPDRVRQAEGKALIRGKKIFAVRAGMRCVDADTEYLSPTGWCRIADYLGGPVAEFRLDGTAHFVEPVEYIKAPADRFWCLSSKGAVDQVLSDHHRILACGPNNAWWGDRVGTVPTGFRSLPTDRTDHWLETSPVRLREAHRRRGLDVGKNRTQRFLGHVPTAFFLKNDRSKIDLTTVQIRLMVAFHADGSLGYDPIKPETPRYGYIRLKRDRKKKRLRAILREAKIRYRESPAKPAGFSVFKFVPPRMTKRYGDEWWRADDRQRRVIVDEVCHWDGGRERGRTGRWYASRHSSDVDFIQYCFASWGTRTVKKWISGRRVGRPVGSDGYVLHITGSGRTNNLALIPEPRPYRKKHDGFMYSFSVPSTYLVFRRNGKIFVSGNTGKTKVVVDYFGELADAGDCLDLVVVAPGGAYRPWGSGSPRFPSAIELDFPKELFNKTKVLVWESRSAGTKRRRDELDDFVEYRDGPRVFVVNAEALSTVKRARELVLEFLRQRPNKNMAAVDESVIIKNRDAAVSAFVVDQLGPLAEYRVIITGLITPRSPLDLWNQFRFLDWQILGHQTYATFEARYARIERVCMVPSQQLYAMLKSRVGLSGYLTRAELQVRAKMFDPDLDVSGLDQAQLREYLEAMVDCVDRNRIPEIIKGLGGYVQTVPMVRGYDYVEELYDKIAPWSWRCRLEDCYDMPASDYSFRDVDWHPEQRRIYEELRANATAELDAMSHVTATHVIVRMMRLHQVLCGHVGLDDAGGVRDVPQRRTAALLDLLRDYDGKAAIWCSYDHSVRLVVEALEREFGPGSVARFWGGNVTTREDEEVRFKTDSDCRFMVGTPDAGRYGRDWSVADLCVFFSAKNNLDHRDQAELRVKADGKTTPVAYVDMRVPGTVEDRIIRCLRDKIDMAAIIDGDAYREWLV